MARRKWLIKKTNLGVGTDHDLSDGHAVFISTPAEERGVGGARGRRSMVLCSDFLVGTAPTAYQCQWLWHTQHRTREN